MSSEERRSLAGLLPEGAVLFDEPMSGHSRSGAGGPAEALAEVASLEELKSLLDWASTHAVDYRFWGRGSSTIVRDRGVSGLLVRLVREFDFARVESGSGDRIFVSAGGAVEALALARMLQEQGLEGSDLLGGFAGTLGGALCSRKDGGEERISEIVEEATVVTREGKELSLRGQALRFESGRLKIPRTAALVRVLLRLRRIESGHDVLPERDSQGAPRISRVFAGAPKTGARLIIEEAGLSGVRVGGARIAPDDSNSIVNEAGASVRDFEVLISLVRDQVRQSSGFSIEPMVEIIGDR